ncbi:hypothetical protein JTE90_018258 [Oedothorax gibbosus]|uniref:Uncharacterized protein n=1 Tax=Oedothorax gibbosus TaxID=931172 RepID=A0AAV6U9G6_9ARAC|nr:hypothetical protein JTE90_018258 [Oedothorax gibbosus]
MIYSICRSGAPSNNTKANLIEEVRTLKSVEIFIEEGTVKGLWAVLRTHATQEAVKSWMDWAMQFFQGTGFIRIKNLIDFGKKRNLTQFYCVVTAFQSCPNFYWEQLYQEVPGEFINFAKAAVGNTDYYGYGPLGDAESRHYRLLGYVGVRLCQKALNQDSLKDFRLNITGATNTKKWDTLVEKYITLANDITNVTHRRERAALHTFRRALEGNEETLRGFVDNNYQSSSDSDDSSGDDGPPRRDERQGRKKSPGGDRRRERRRRYNSSFSDDSRHDDRDDRHRGGRKQHGTEKSHRSKLEPDTFTRQPPEELKLKTGSGQETRHVHPYKYTTIMSFVTPFLVNREQQSNLSSGESDEDVHVTATDPVFGSPFVGREVVWGIFCLHLAS